MKRIDIPFNEVIADLRRVYKEHGNLTARIYDKYGKWNSQLLLKRLGTFTSLKRIAVPNSKTRSYNIPRDALVKDILHQFELHDGYLTKEEYVKEGKYSRKPIDRIFGSWNKMLKELGLNVNCLINIPDEDLFAELNQLYDEFGTISATIMKYHGKYSVEVYTRRFGSWNEALQKAGIKPISIQGSTSPEADAMIELIASVLDTTPIHEAMFDWLINPNTKKPFRIDAYYPDYRLAFEYNGPQHYMPINAYGGKPAFEIRRELDEIKSDMILNHDLKLFTMKYDELRSREHIIKRLSQILGE